MASPTTSRPAALRHIAALDGLRGVGVAAVLLFHGTTSLPGGYLGVDLFFVLSGFLITTLLLREHATTGRVDLGAFWGRRARRLLPAMLVVVLAVMALAAAGALDATGAVRGDAVATLTYWANWRFVAEGTDYFAAFRAPSPLRHTWSLAIEEQWYVVWPPVLVLLLTRTARRLLPAVIAALAAASALAMVVVADDVNRAYYGTDTRVQALLAGALLAVVLDRHPITGMAASRWVAAAGALAAVPVGLMIWQAHGDASWMYRGGFSAFAALSAVVVAAATLPGGVVPRLLALPPLTALGRISYGLYLWHWPIALWLTPDRARLSGWSLFALRTAVAVAVAVASYLLVERPIRLGRPILRVRLPVVGAAAALAVTAAVVALPLQASLTGPGAGAPPGEAAAGLDGFPTDDADLAPVAVSVLDEAPVGLPTDRPPRVMVVGDSVGWTLSQWLGPIEGAEVLTGSLIGCGADPASLVDGDRVVPMVGDGGASCDQAAAFWAARVRADQPDLVLLTLGAWEVYDRQDAERGRLDVGTDAWHAWTVERVEAVAAHLAAAGRAPIVVPEVPCFDEDELELGTSASPRNDPRRIAAVNAALAEVVARHPARLASVPMSAWLCEGGEPVDEREGIELRPDGVHYEPDSARLTWERWLLPRIHEALASG